MSTPKKYSLLLFAAGLFFLVFHHPILHQFKQLGFLALLLGSAGVVIFLILPMLWEKKLVVLAVFVVIVTSMWKATRWLIRWIRKRKQVIPRLTDAPHEAAEEVTPVTSENTNLYRVSNEQMVTSSATGFPVHLLPRNPKRTSSSQWSKEEAAYQIGNAIYLAGITPESNDVEVLSVQSGPSLQTITFRLPEKVQYSKLDTKAKDLANHLGLSSGFEVRSGSEKSSCAFVIPHTDRAYVYLREGLENPEFQEFASKASLPLIFGMNSVGKPMMFDLAKLPHMLLAGATGSGKSVFINSVLTCLMMLRSPEELQLVLIDPKMVELSVYKGYPHLMTPPIIEMKKASRALLKIVEEMDRRYEKLMEAGVRNIQQYNSKQVDKMPFIVVVVDEYADLMLVAGNEIEDYIQRIAQKARAAGIHIILGTQRPSVDVVTGVIKANLPSRVAFQLQGPSDFQTVMGRNGPALMGYGDGVVMVNGGTLVRFQSAALSAIDDESTVVIERLKEYWNQRHKADTIQQLDLNQESEIVVTNNEMSDKMSSEEEEAKYRQAVNVVNNTQIASAVFLQRQLRIGYILSARFIKRMEREGIVETTEDGIRRKVLVVDAVEVEPEENENQNSDDELIKELKYQICITRSARSNHLRQTLGIRKDKVLKLMQQLVEEGFLLAPTSQAGYQLNISDDDRRDYILKAYAERYGDDD